MTGRQWRHLGLQLVRRAVQLCVIALVLGVVLLSLYSHYRAAHAVTPEDVPAGWRGKALIAIDRHMEGVKDPEALLAGYKGTLWSMKLGPVQVTDPLAIVEASAATRHVYWPFVVSGAILAVLTLLFGRVFCSWICPGYVLFELSGKLRRLLKLAELAPGEVRFSHLNKYYVLGGGLVCAFGIGLPVFALVYPPAVLSRLAHAWIFGTGVVGMLALLGGILAFELLVSPRWWCRSVCPGGALYGLLGWARPVRIRLDASRCTGCQECVPVCEAGIHPVREARGIECDSCAVCIRRCPEDALGFTLSLPGSRGKPRTKATAEVSTASPALRKLPMALGALLLLLAGAPRVEAHHILGLPHYSYKEDYPQAPTLEYPAQAGPYSILLTTYPGSPVPGEAARVALYIKDRRSGVAFTEPVSVRILRTYTFGASAVALPSLETPAFEPIHELTFTFPEEGEYVVELRMQIDGKEEVIPFAVVAGNPSAGVSVLVAGVLGVLLLLIVVRAIRIKRRRRQARAGMGAYAQPGPGTGFALTGRAACDRPLLHELRTPRPRSETGRAR